MNEWINKNCLICESFDVLPFLICALVFVLSNLAEKYIRNQTDAQSTLEISLMDVKYVEKTCW